MTDPRLCPECGGLMSRHASRCRTCSLPTVPCTGERPSGRRRWARHRARRYFERHLEGATIVFVPPKGMGRKAFARVVERVWKEVFW